MRNKILSFLAAACTLIACTPETIQTAFAVKGAKASITINVVNEEGQPITGYDLSVFSTADRPVPTISGNVITLEAEENTVIPAQTITVTITHPDYAKPYETQIAIPDILAGGIADLQVKVVLYAEPVDDWILTYKTKEPLKTLDAVAFLKNDHYQPYEHAYTHKDAEGYEIDIKTWYLNDSEYILNGKAQYQYSPSSDVLNLDIYNPKYEEEINQIANLFVSNPAQQDKTFSFSVSAFSMYTVWQKFFTEIIPVEVIAENTATSEMIKVASFTIVSKNNSVVEYQEKALPDEMKHNPADHGDAHGHSHDYTPNHGSHDNQHDNAGGGIVLAE